MKYENQRPDLEDQIKRLVQSANSVKTVPHGIKTVNPGEGLQLLSGDGSSIFWDWETAREYDDRIASGQAAIAEAEAALAQTRLDLDAAGERITDARLEIAGAVTQAAEAKQLVETTASTLAGVDTRLTATAGELSTLKTTVGDVSTAVTASEQKAAEAQATATTAATTAEDARLAAVAAEDRVRALANAQGSLIIAGGFETATDENAAFRFAVAGARTGAYVGRYRANEAAPEVRWPEVRASSSQRLEMRMYAMRSGTVGAAEPYGCLFYRDAAGTLMSLFPNSSSIRPAVNTTWQEYIFRFDPLPAGARSVTFRSGSRSNGSTESGYILLDDVTAYDTASYQEALDTALAAQAEAKAAATAALAAMTRANQAYDSAQGKNAIRHATTDPQGQGTATGDVWWKWTSFPGGVVTGQWTWDGTAWREQKASHQTLASLDLGKATVGQLHGSYLTAGSVAASRMSIGVGENALADPYFADVELSNERASSSTGTWARNITASEITYRVASTTSSAAWRYGGINLNRVIPTTGGRKWRLNAFVAADGGQARINVRWYDISGASTYVAAGTYVAASGKTEITADWTAPEAATGFTVDLFFPAETKTRAIAVYGGAAVRTKTGSVLIEDGAITGEKVAAESVAAKIGQFVKVQAANVEVTEALAARVVNAMTANLKNLVVTESAVLQHSTLLGTTIIERLNLTGELVGRDAIFAGTVDVAQLNVTNAMSAEIVKAMDIQARRGIFTEGLTAAEATLLGTTVAENLNADTIGARLVQAGAIVSRDSTGSVQMTPAGLVLQDATPGSTAYTRQVKLTSSGLQGGTRTTQTVNIDGQDNWLMGTFRTALTGSRVSMLSGPTSGILDLWGSANDDHGSVWYDTASSSILNHALTLMGISDYSTNTNNPALRMFPYRGTFAFQGRWARDTDPLKFQVVTNSAGLGPGVYNTFTVSYLSAFPTNNALRFPFVSVESATGADVMATIVSQTQTGVTINVINQSSGKASGALILKVMTLNVGSS